MAKRKFLKFRFVRPRVKAVSLDIYPELAYVPGKSEEANRRNLQCLGKSQREVRKEIRKKLYE